MVDINQTDSSHIQFFVLIFVVCKCWKDVANMNTIYEQGCKKTGSSVSAITSGPCLSVLTLKIFT